jgi:hypothetical protein
MERKRIYEITSKARENAKPTQGYTRIECAYSVTTVNPETTAANISATSSGKSNEPANWEDEAKHLSKALAAMQADKVESEELVEELQHQLKELRGKKNLHDDWEECDSDGKHSSIKQVPAPPINVVTGPYTTPCGKPKVTQTQAKLAKKLIKLASTYKVPELTFAENATRHRLNYQGGYHIFILISP